MNLIFKSEKDVIIFNLILFLLVLIPDASVLIIPIMILFNFILAILCNKNRKVMITFLIFTFLSPLIGMSICSWVYPDFRFN